MSESTLAGGLDGNVMWKMFAYFVTISPTAVTSISSKQFSFAYLTFLYTSPLPPELRVLGWRLKGPVLKDPVTDFLYVVSGNSPEWVVCHVLFLLEDNRRFDWVALSLVDLLVVLHYRKKVLLQWSHRCRPNVLNFLWVVCACRCQDAVVTEANQHVFRRKLIISDEECYVAQRKWSSTEVQHRMQGSLSSCEVERVGIIAVL